MNQLEELSSAIDTVKKALHNSSDYYDRLFELPKAMQSEYVELLRIFKQTNGSTTHTANEKGESLENLVTFLIQNSGFLSVQKNVRNSSNEIDILMKLNPMSESLISESVKSYFADYSLGECKNYNRGVDVTWIGKFYSLLSYTNLRLGIIFSYHGVTGKNPCDGGKGLIEKIHLSNSFNTLILDFSLKDFESIVTEEKNLHLILCEKIDVARSTFSLPSNKHPNQNKLKKIIVEQQLESAL